MEGKTNHHKRDRRWLLRQGLYAAFLLLLTGAVLLFPLQVLSDVQENVVAARDIRSPREYTYASAILTEQARQEAMRQVEPVYTRVSPQDIRAHIEHVRQALRFISSVRADPYATPEEKVAWLNAVPELATLLKQDAELLLSLPDATWNTVQLETLRLLDDMLRQLEIRPEDLADVRDRVPALVPTALALDEATAVTLLIEHFLRANSFLDEAATKQARETAAGRIVPVPRTILRGEIIVREGSVVTAQDIEALTALGLLRSETQNRDWINAFLLALGGVALLGMYLFSFAPQVLDNATHELLLFLALSLFMGLARFFVPSGSLLPYLFPIAALSMILATTLGFATAVAGTIFVAGVAAWIGGRSLELVTLYGLSGLVAILLLPRYETTSTIFRSGLVSGLFGVVMMFSFTPMATLEDGVTLALRALLCLLAGMLSAALALGGLFVLAPLFDFATTFRLLELSRPDQPLLKRLLREAPGTYHHVMMVASMAEQAAERIGANVLLTRVGAYYHDIGKLKRPYFFIENQLGISNPHDRLDPITSASLLAAHVTDGLELAQQAHLPQRVRDFIPEHHGTSRVSFFYQKALDRGGEATLNEADFHYPGPRPQSKETALVMLADGCEAAARARRTSDAAELTALVERIFDQRIKNGQLDECNLTLRELALVRATYIELLRGAYHPRIQYPQPKEGTHDEKSGA